MSKVFRRPMFRGGSTNMNGIMSDIEDRENYDAGGSARERLAKVAAEYPSQAIDPLSQFLIQGGLNLVSQPSTGGVLSDIASAAKEPTTQLFQGLSQEGQLGKKLALEGEMIDIEGERQERLARLKATTDSGLQKDYSDQRAYETAMENRISSKNDLNSFEKPNIYQKFPEQTAEYDYLIKRDLRKRAQTDSQAAEILQNSKYLPFDTKRQEFVYDNLIAGSYYYNPQDGVFITRVPATDENTEDEYFEINPYTFNKVKIIPK